MSLVIHFTGKFCKNPYMGSEMGISTIPISDPMFGKVEHFPSMGIPINGFKKYHECELQHPQMGIKWEIHNPHMGICMGNT